MNLKTRSHARLPRIALLATGGTIAGAPSADGQTRYVAGAVDIARLLQAVPGLSARADLRAEQVINIGSQNMTHEVWLTLAARVLAVQAEDDIDGIVIAHGTDTLEETAYFLSLVVPAIKPLILVGAMRPAHALSADGPANLMRAVALASEPAAGGCGPLVVMNDTFHRAADVQKMASCGVHAFASRDSGPLGMIPDHTPIFLQNVQPAASPDARFPLHTLIDSALPEVAIVYAHAGMNPRSILDIAQWADGIVLAGVGDGNATDAAWDALRQAVAKGVAVVRATRCATGPVIRNGEIDDDRIGTLAAGWLSPQKARILLMLALTRTRDAAELRSSFDLH